MICPTCGGTGEIPDEPTPGEPPIKRPGPWAGAIDGTSSCPCPDVGFNHSYAYHSFTDDEGILR